tara:strand:+ start:1507 stop:1845 length:339 start_codon:yes stop_codon:yes gene_type:complete
METLIESMNLILMMVFILLYSVLVMVNDVTSKLANFFRNAVYMSSGMLFVYYIFQISYLVPYKEFEYLIAFLVALSFRDLLPVLVDFVVHVSTAKLKQIDARISSSKPKKGE